jgi:multisubunit Na+/H+ antiporter MnhG subunit
MSAVCCLLSAVCCLLSTVCCLLSIVCCLMSAVCCLLSAVCCLLSTVSCLLSAVCCLLSAVCCLLSAVCCLQSNDLWTLLSPQGVCTGAGDRGCLLFNGLSAGGQGGGLAEQGENRGANTVRCLLSALCGLLSAVCYLQFTTKIISF